VSGGPAVALRVRSLPFARRVIGGVNRAQDRVFSAWSSRVDSRVTLLVGASMMTVGLGLATSGLHVRLGFYEVLAQVLPVLLLVVVVEGRYFRGLEQREPLDRFVLRGFLFVPLLGEVAALGCVAVGHDSLWLRGASILGLGVVVLMLVVYASDGPARSRSTRGAAVATAVRTVRSAAEQHDAAAGGGEGDGAGRAP
jgi:hypothetical protein